MMSFLVEAGEDLLQEAIYNKRNLRMTVEGVPYRMRVGCPWRDLPQAFGCWNSIYKSFNAWSLSDKWSRIFKTLTIGKNRAGNTAKIHLAVDNCGLPVEFEITGGEVNDCSAAPQLIARLPDAQAIVADKGYDSECTREQIVKKGAKAVIPRTRKRNSLKGNTDMDWGLYRFGGKRLCPAKAVSCSGNTIRQTEEKF